MKKRYKDIAIEIAIPIIISLFALFLRLYFFQGFILGDDPMEVSLVDSVLDNGPNFLDQLGIRFGLWIFNVPLVKLFGMSEFSFFLPTLLMSATFALIGYYLLTFWRYPRIHAFLASLFIASAPFEVLLGTVRANDVIFSWLIALGFFSFIVFEKKPVLQGLLMSFFLWFAFYVKIWVVYIFPALGLYYLVQIIKHKKWRGFISFFLFSALFHGITSIFWEIKTGSFIPYIYYHPATYPTPKDQLLYLFQVYPKMIFQGSDFGTTLFGMIPYLLIFLLILKAVLPKTKKRFKKLLGFDKIDIYLLVYYGSFFLFLNFFPNTFQFNQFYSAPRIFRYLAPISFPMTLHLAKSILDFSRISFTADIIGKCSLVLLFMILIFVNIHQTNIATKPGQIYRETLFSIVKDVKEQSPPKLVVESWASFFLRKFYLREEQDTISIVPIYNIDDAKKYEQWLQENQHNLTEGSMMISGIGSYVQYGCHNCGFRLRQFNGSLNPGWKLFKEYQNQSYLPIPEPARLWVWLPSSK